MCARGEDGTFSQSTGEHHRNPHADTHSEAMSERQASGPMTGNSKASVQEEKKNNLPPDFDIDMDAPETAKAAVTIQSQFRKFQKKKQDVKS
ncbi:calmodulin regulator protein PCP4a isoform X2 [Pundamilia nyererei]|uniref:Calmodulin regulator protein PCP4a isoform X2 n=2 Tax=Pseudocrenilabrinae TaxID=318546 RepID=A0A9Y3RJR4_9CICH|nr:PREDICTED: Purkinje cell protein 4-like isoform X2 [Pundamilia nyererei]XP_005936023.1 calmodulin regulator protein PCP4a isoform X2 [Haplochromis burtoni]XP_026038591.1 calmodulin regulator protein PCP4-like isoform X3 [Astatotilapia calliptera]